MSIKRIFGIQLLLLTLMIFCVQQAHASGKKEKGIKFYPADNPAIQYTGRIDFGNSKLPRFWQPGVYIRTNFSGSYCAVILNDENLWGKNYNYLEIVVDGVEKRIQTRARRDTILVAEGLSDGVHELTICKNTEANIGYLELVGFRCKNLMKPAKKPARKMEFIGNSITCGTGSDQSVVPCGKGVWQDQHNAYLSYGAITARKFNAQYHLSAVSGIGLMHSCCNLDITMPQVFDKISMRQDSIDWDFKNYQPDMVTICLGQNDGIQDSAMFCDNYISFLRQLRRFYPGAELLLLSSPMADASLTAFMKKTLTEIKNRMNKEGDSRVSVYFFGKQYHNGCDGHPDLAEHRQIADELTMNIKKIMKW